MVMLNFDEKKGADNVEVGASGRPVRGRTVAGAVNHDMIDENGENCCVHTCAQCCVETEVVIGSQSYVNCVATFATFILCHHATNTVANYLLP